MRSCSKMNKRITIQEFTSTVDDEGYQRECWENKTMVWASIKNLHGTEFFQAQAVSSKATCKITIRYIKGLNSKMRIIYKDKIYNILYLDNINENNRYIEMMCEVVE